MLPRSVSRHRRVRRPGGGLFPLLAVLAVAAAGCGLAGPPRTTPTTRVLGETRGTTLAVGQPAPAGTGELDAVSCATARRCWAVGVAGPNPAPAGGEAVIVATVDGGASWKAQRVAGGSAPQLSAISCPTATSCMAVGSNGASLPGSGVVVTTRDAGSTWSPAAAPPNALVVTSVACAGVASCTAIVNDGAAIWSAHTVDFGQTWQREGNLPSAFLPGDDLSCTTSGTCIVAGYVPTDDGHGSGAVALSADGGQSWALATTPQGIGVLQSATCLSASACLAAGTTQTTVSDVVPGKGELLRSDDGGHTWIPSTTAVPLDDIYGIACPSAEQCAMVGAKWVGFPAVATGAAAQSRNGGMTFRASPAAYVPLALTALSCPTTSACVAAGGDTLARLTLEAPRRPPAPERSHGLPRG